LTSRTRIALVATTVLTLAVPAAAHAATKTVYMGAPPKDQKKLNQPYGADVVDFFPNNVTIVAGDSIRFDPVAFHNVDIPPKGGKMIAQLAQGAPITGFKDAAGAPFWFSDKGLPNFAFAPELQSQSNGLGKKLTYTGAKRVISHIPLNTAHPFGTLKPMVVKFPKAGKVTYYCDLHPGMKGTVTVLKKGKAAPTAAQDAKTLKKQFDAEFKVAKTLRDAKAPANTMYVGYAGLKGKVEYFNFLPNTLTVPVGTTVTFAMSPGSFETHTATTGPGDYLTDPTSYIGFIADSFNLSQFDPRGVYPSDTIGTIGTLTPSSHGNGFWNSGALDTQAATLPQSSAKVTFTAAGTYKFACLVHPVMRGTVIVH
jgi:plastocyanin